MIFARACVGGEGSGVGAADLIIVAGEAMVQRLLHGPLRSKALELGIVTEDELDGMVKAWEEWMVTSDATLGLMNGEVIVRKREHIEASQ